jgi:hypothetical protein
MKKTLLLTLAAVSGFIFLVSMTSASSKDGDLKKNAPATAGVEIPDSILQFVRTACMDCHSNEGSSIARGKLNFSKWAEYDADKQKSKAAECCEEMAKGDMPPKKWRAKKPDLVPTQEQMDKFCRWTKTLSK